MIESLKYHIKVYWFSYLLSIASIYLFFTRYDYSIFDFLDLLIHEPGHLIFSVFGEFMGFLGGTLSQILIPLIGSIFYVYWKKKIGAQLFLFWLGQNFLNISVYVEDVPKMKLKLIGGIHDWNWILGKLGMIDFAKELSLVCIGLAFLSFCVMFFTPKFIVRNEEFIDLHIS